MKVFTAVGVILTIVGVFFLIQVSLPSQATSPADVDTMHQAAPILALVLLPMGLLFITVGLWVTRVNANRSKLFAQGLAGEATIVSAVETGMTVNDRPVAKLTMSILLPGRTSYTVEHREVVPLLALGMITPGSTLPVAVDPVDPQKLAIDWSGQMQARALNPMAANRGAVASGPGAVSRPNTLSRMGSTTTAPKTVGAQVAAPPIDMGIFAGQDQSITTIDLGTLIGQAAQAGVSFSPGTAAAGTVATQTPGVTINTGGDPYHAQLEALRTSGSSGRALIKSVQDIGVAIQGEKVENFELEVTPDVGSGYTVQHVGFVPASAVSRAMAGTSVRVHIDRTNPQNVVIDWAAS
jgi:hypothetical protein